MRTAFVPLGLLILLLATAAPAFAVETCHVVNAKGVGQITTFDPVGGTGTTTSRIIGGGLLHGTTAADLVFTSPDLTTFEGTLVLTTDQGTLTLFVFNGVFDLTTGEFSSDSTVIGGTGRFEGATGSLYFHGFTDFSDFSFVDDEISGNICADLP
jgi:hypothetical protein